MPTFATQHHFAPLDRQQPLWQEPPNPLLSEEDISQAALVGAADMLPQMEEWRRQLVRPDQPRRPGRAQQLQA